MLSLAKTPNTTISTILKRNPESIRNALKRIKRKLSNPPLISRINKGRITKLNPRTKRQLNRDLTRSPKKTNKRLLLENNVPISIRGLQRFIKEEGYNINVSNKKPLVNKKNRIKRVSYYKEQLRRLKNKEFNLKKIIFSDESGIEAGKGGRPEYYRKRGKKGVQSERIATTTTSTFKKIPNKLFFYILFLFFFYQISFFIALLLIKL